jgi:hypothetical protein
VSLSASCDGLWRANSWIAEDKEAERAKKRDAKIAAEHDKSAAKEEKQRAKDAVKEEKQRDQETARLQRGAVVESARSHEQRDEELARDSTDAEPTSPQKKSPWKKLIPHRSEREPGRISKIDNKNKDKNKAAVAVPLPEDGFAAATGKTTEPSEPKKSVDLTPTGATMAGDGPSTIAAPDAAPAPENEQATTPIEERSSPIATESSSSRKVDDVEDTPSPASPSKKRFSRLMGKLKRGRKEGKTEGGDAAETNSFTGGAKLHKQRESTASGTTDSTTGPPTTNTGVAAATSAPTRSRSPSISSLSSEDDAEPRGRSATRLDHVASHVAAIKDSESDEGEWEEARDRLDGELAPPNKGLLSRKHAATESPVRDSKFVEDI